MKLRSIRTRLMVWTGLLMTIILSIGSLVIYHAVRSSLYEEIDSALAGAFELQSLEIEVVGEVIEHEWLEDLKKNPLRVLEDYIQVWDVRTGETFRSPALTGGDLPRVSGVLNESHFTTCELPNGRNARALGMLIYPTTDSLVPSSLSAVDYPYVMVMAYETQGIDRALNRLFYTLLIGLAVLVCVSAFAISSIVRTSLLPIQQLEEDILSVDVNNPLDVLKIPTDLPKELVGLGQEYGELLGRISSVRLRERDFASNASHELRTPLAGIQAILEQALAQPREGSDYQRRIEEALSVTHSMHALVSRLMWLSRLQNGTEPVEQASVDLHAMIDQRCSILAESAVARSITIQQQYALLQVTLQSDDALLSILLSNLIGNAVAHAPLNSTISVQTEACATGLCLRVSNPSAGLKPADVVRLTEPFYRQDSVRSAEDGHFGIGLALAEEIAKTLQLKLSLRVATDGIFTAEVIFPQK